MTINDRIQARRTTLTKQRAERKDADDLPRTLTQREVNAYHAETVALDQRIAESKVGAWAASPTIDADAAWRDHLVEWHQTIDDELKALPPRTRNEQEQEQRQRLVWSIRLIDFGLGIAASLPIADLSFTRIGQLMSAAGYEVQGEALRGPRGWRGSLPEVEARIKVIAKQRAAAEAALDVALMDDAEREKQEAEQEAHRTALATMVLKHNAEGTGLVAFTKDGDPLAVSDMTPEQQAAFERFAAVACPPRESVPQ